MLDVGRFCVAAALCISLLCSSAFGLCRNPDRVDSIVAAHPGLLQTELAHKWLHNGCPRFLRPVGVPIIDFLFPKVFLPPEYAVQTILRAATAPDDQVYIYVQTIPFITLSCHRSGT